MNLRENLRVRRTLLRLTGAPTREILDLVARCVWLAAIFLVWCAPACQLCAPKVGVQHGEAVAPCRPGHDLKVDAIDVVYQRAESM